MNLRISTMSTAEKLAAMEELWASLQSSSESIEPPAWHGEILAERREKIVNGETTFSTLKEVRERLENRRK